MFLPVTSDHDGPLETVGPILSFVFKFNCYSLQRVLEAVWKTEGVSIIYA